MSEIEKTNVIGYELENEIGGETSDPRPISKTAGYEIETDPKEMTSLVKIKKSTTSTW